MVGKAKVYETKTDKLISLSKNVQILYGLDRIARAPKQTNISPGGATPSSSGSSGGSGNFLETQGDTMVGPIAFNQVLVVALNGRMKIGEQDRTSPTSPIDYSSYVALTGQGTPDDINWIDGAAFNGQVLWLQGTVTQIINLINAIYPTIQDISGTGTVTVVTDLNHGLVTGQQVNIKTTTNFDVNAVTITVTNPTTFTYSDAGDATPETSGNVQDGNIVTNDGVDVIMDGSIGNQTRPIVQLIFDQLPPLGGAWNVSSRSDFVDLLPLNNTWTGSNTFTGATFSVTSGIINLGDNVADTINLIGSTEVFSPIDLNDQYIQFDATAAPSDPPATELRLFSDSGNSDHISIRRIGSTIDLEVAVTDRIQDGNTDAIVLDAAPSFVVRLDGVQKYSISNTRIDLEDLDVFGVETMFFNDTGGSPTFVSMGAQSASIFQINVIDANDAIDITHAGDLSARFQDGRFQLFSITPNTLSAAMSMFKDDPSPTIGDAVANIDFDGNNSIGAFTTYVKILGGIGDPLDNNEEGRLTIQVQGGSNMLVNCARFGHQIAHNTAIFNDAFMELDEVVIPPNPAANKGRIYLRDVAAVTTPFFLDSSGVETSLIGGGGGSSFADDVFDIHDNADVTKILQFQLVNLLTGTTSFFATEPITVAGKTWTLPNINGTFIMTAGAQTLTATKTWDNGANNAILLKAGGKLEFETAGSGVNFEMHGQNNMRDPANPSTTSREGLEIDLNTGAIPDTEVFGIGDGEANPWFIIDDDAARFTTSKTGAVGHEFYLAREVVLTDADKISTLLFQGKKDSTTYFKYAFIEGSAITVSTTAASNVGRVRFGAVSNNLLNTGFTVEGIASSSNAAISFYNQGTVGRQTITGSRGGNAALADLLTKLANTGLIIDSTT